MNNTRLTRWPNFVKELANLIFFWFFGILFFALYRLTFWGVFYKYVSEESSLIDYLRALVRGFQFDAMMVVLFVSLPLVLLLLIPIHPNIAAMVRRVCQKLFVVLSALLCILNLNFFAEYHDQFNNFLFMGLVEDKAAILDTIWKSYHPIWNSLAVIAISVLGIKLFRYFEPKERIEKTLLYLAGKSAIRRALVVLVVLFCCYFSLRGRVTIYNNLRNKDAFVAKNIYLNKTIINPYRTVVYAYRDFKRFSNTTDKNPYGAFKADEPKVSEKLTKEVKHGFNLQHDQVFFILMESYDIWSLADEMQELGVSNNLRAIADKGIFYTHVLPSYHATFYAIATTTTSMPYAGVDLSIAAMQAKPYKTSMFPIMESLGYNTNFFYGGFASWHNVGDYIPHEGCDNFYSASNLPDSESMGTWGVDDEYLFNYVLDTVDPNKKSFNMIMTTSYHAPYAIDVVSKGYPYKTEEDVPERYRSMLDGSMTVNQLGHLWYGDKTIGDFVREAEKKYPNALFVFVGDHYGRRYLNASPTLYQASAVPFILYGKGIEPELNDTPGGHMDILPTLLDLEAPKGFTYASFGQSMFDTDKPFGIGYDKIITKEAIYVKYGEGNVVKESLTTGEKTELPDFLDEHKLPYNNILRDTWQYVAKESVE